MGVLSQEQLQEIGKYGLDEARYEALMRDLQGKYNKENDLDYNEILLKYGCTAAAESLRKASKTPFGSAFYANFLAQKAEIEGKNNDEKSIKNQIRELQIERIKFRDERRAWNKQNYETARFEENLEILNEIIENLAKKEFKIDDWAVKKVTNSGKTMVVCLSDIHFGEENDSVGGKYNPQICEERLKKYLTEIIATQEIMQCEECFCLFLGDLIAGNIHTTIRIENKEEVDDQVAQISDLLFWFVEELSKNFNVLKVNSVAGNHSRVGKKDEVLRGERLDNIPFWFIKRMTNAQKKYGVMTNVEFVDDKNYDPTIGRIEVYDKEYLIVHGDMDGFNDSGIHRLREEVKSFFYGIFCGHRHTCAYNTIADTQLIQSGCFSGSGSDYCVSRRMSGFASQMICILDKDGVKMFQPVKLD